MASQPLAALAIRPPAQQDPGEAIQRALTLRALMNQAQYQQQLQPLEIQRQKALTDQATLQNQIVQKQIQDQQTMSSLAPQYTIKDDSGRPTGFDEEGFAQSAMSKGVNPLTINAWRQNNAETRTKLANADEAVRKNAEALNSEAYNRLESVRSISDPAGRQQAWDAGRQWAQQRGIDTSKWAQAPPDDNGLNAIEAMLGMHAQQVADAGKQAETQQKLSEAVKSKYITSNGTLLDISGKTPVPAVPSTLDPAKWSSLVDSVVPTGKNGENAALNARTKMLVQFAVNSGNAEAANKAITEAANQMGAIEKEVNPSVIKAQVGKAVATHVGEIQAEKNAFGANIPPPPANATHRVYGPDGKTVIGYVVDNQYVSSQKGAQ
jgi:hypothetical protein